MKKRSPALLIILVLLISMTVFLVGCNNKNGIVGTWKDHNNVVRFIFEKNGKIVKYENFGGVDEFKWQYNKEKKCYEIIHIPTGVTHNNLKLIDNDTLQEAYDTTPRTFTRVS